MRHPRYCRGGLKSWGSGQAQGVDREKYWSDFTAGALEIISKVGLNEALTSSEVQSETIRIAPGTIAFCDIIFKKVNIFFVLL
jgi:hypothetical protein